MNNSSRTKYPIFTLPILNGRIYIVNSIELAISVHKLPKSLSFWYPGAIFGRRLTAVSKEAADKLVYNVHRDQGPVSVFSDMFKLMHDILRSGDEISSFGRSVTRSLVKSLESFDRALETGREIRLWDWVKHQMTMMTTEAAYGPLNPYRDSSVEKAFWDFSEHTTSLTLDFLPSIFARSGYFGRQKLALAFERYFANSGHKLACTLTQERHQILKLHDISDQDIASFEALQGVTILANTIPAAFWTIFHILSKPHILDRVRKRAEGLMMRDENTGIQTLRASLLGSDPLLQSVMQEALRHQSFGAPFRMVMQDVMLEGRYLLKAGSMVMMPSEAIHFDASIWKDLHAFDVQRRKPRADAFRAFGGGANLCPGRALAAFEIICMATLLALKYDVTTLNEGGEWVAPEPDRANMTANVTPPKQDVLVRVTARRYAVGASWKLEF